MKKGKKGLAVIAMAAVMLTQLMPMTVFADDYQTYYSDEYPWYSRSTGFYYSSKESADSQNAYDLIYCGPQSGIDSSGYPSSVYPWYESYTNRYYRTKSDASTAGGYYANIIYAYNAADQDYSTYYTSSYPWYNSYTNRYYRSRSDAQNAGGGASYVTYINSYDYSTYYTSSYPWYNSYTKRYYRSRSDAQNAGGGASYVTYINSYDYSTYYSSAYPWYNSYTRRYYRSKADAQNAGGGASYVSYGDNASNSYSSSYSSTYPWYNSYTKRYYRTESAAINAGGGSRYVSYGDQAIYDYSTKYSSTYPWYNSYTKRYYRTQSAALHAGGNSSNVYKVKNSNSNKTTTSSGDPYINGHKNLSGWATIVKYINNLDTGDTLTVRMNKKNVIDSSVLRAMKGRDVNVRFITSNGIRWTINGKNISGTTGFSIYSNYYSKAIPSYLSNKVSKGAAAKSQIYLSSSNSYLGAQAEVTIKFSARRAGYRADIYIYNEYSDRLIKVGTSKVSQSGMLTFDVDSGGAYLIVLS